MCSVYTNVSLNFALPKGRLSMCGNRGESTNGALSILIVPLKKAIFGLGGLGFCQKVYIYLIPQFGQTFKDPSKCMSGFLKLVHVVKT